MLSVYYTDITRFAERPLSGYVVLSSRALQFVNNALSSYWTDEDDMLFAVFRNPGAKTPFMAMRRDPGVLPKELMYGSDMYNSIDWKATVLLNMAMHARFRLTLAVGGYSTQSLSDGSTVPCAARACSRALKSTLLCCVQARGNTCCLTVRCHFATSLRDANTGIFCLRETTAEADLQHPPQALPNPCRLVRQVRKGLRARQHVPLPCLLRR